MTQATPHAAVIGAGPAGLMAAETLARANVSVTVYDRMPSPGRKFLLAGRGGLNLTHSEEFERFLSRYGKAAPLLRTAVEAFPPSALRAWCEALGQETFVGTSGRVFPKAMKASPLLRAWLKRLAAMDVTFKLRHRWAGWDGGALLFDTPDGPARAAADVTILALGGASWPRLGSDGRWTALLAEKGVAATPLRPSNCGFAAEFSDLFRARFEGQPLKGVELHFAGASVRGEAVITKIGLEGGAVYALSPLLRDAIERSGEAVLGIDLRPGLPAAELEGALSKPRGKQSVSNFLRKAVKLTPAAVGLLQEATHGAGVPLTSLDTKALAALIKRVPVRLTATAPIERAISTAGGVAFDEIDSRFMLRRAPGVFVAGEMLDWEAPTGGYLLQACFSTGAAAARGAMEWLAGLSTAQAHARVSDHESR
ncbi:MAG: TIGR03862 family flavoprotein [Rhodomicrobium sp.]